MRSKRTSVLRTRLFWTLLILFTFISAHATYAASSESPLAAPSTAGILQHDGVLSQADGSYMLAATAAPAPRIFGDYARHGLLIAEPLIFAQPISRVKISYTAGLPFGTALYVDLRGSIDGVRWLPWQTDLSTSTVVGFAQPIRRAQYRLTLLGGLNSSPIIRQVSLEASQDQAQVIAPGGEPVAPTLRIRATRQGMIGGRTANGFRIPPQARFVSLPCRCVLSSQEGNEYQVRISYRGRSTVVPVYDVGPYSSRDDYWDPQRDGFPQLDRGWPMDHAAYYEGFNQGQADKGYVYYPTAMDVGDGAWQADLGIVGDQAEVEVTFLWMGRDPLAGPQLRDPNQPEQIVDELGADFWHSTSFMNSSPMGCGFNRHAYQTVSVSDPGQSTVVTRWQPQLPVAGQYDLFVHVPICPGKRPPVSAARYVIQHRDGAVEVAINQATQTGWVLLGRFPFNADSSGFIQLSDLAGAPGGAVWFDQAKWVRVS